jgi:hypothetical protein
MSITYCIKFILTHENFPVHTYVGPEGFRILRFSWFLDSRHMKVARLSALLTGLLYTLGYNSRTYFS